MSRITFEAWVTAPPYELSVERFPDSERYQWPGQYKNGSVQFAWEAYQFGLTQPRKDDPQ